MPELPVGPILAALDVTLDLDEGQQVVEAIVIGRVVDLGDDDHANAILVIGKSTDMDWITQRGLVSAAQYVLDNTGLLHEGDEE